MMKEELIQFVWQYGLFNQSHLKTVQNQELKIFKSGDLNTNQGPDFLNSKIQIGEVTWAGNVEIHIKTSDFYKHKHHLDPAFQNLILHVVYENDIVVGDLPVLELKDKINSNIITEFTKIKLSKSFIPCEHFIKKIDSFLISNWLQRLSIQRLESKCNTINSALNSLDLNWEKQFWQMLFKYMGGTVNKQSFETLAQKIDFNYLIKNANRPFFVEAYLFGLAGMLNENINDLYYQKLVKEFNYIKQTQSVEELKPELWKFMRMRPASFPTVRIAQIAALIRAYPRLFANIVETESIDKIKLFFNQEIDQYWKNHYVFGKEIEIEKGKRIGSDQIEIVIINVIAPLLFSYGRINSISSLEERALLFLEQLKPEDNKIVREFVKLGVKSINASESQGLLELYNNYCLSKKCLSCNIGNKILRNFVN